MSNNLITKEKIKLINEYESLYYKDPVNAEARKEIWDRITARQEQVKIDKLNKYQ